jgi:NADH:ubiquinone oxidoreductase subunit D
LAWSLDDPRIGGDPVRLGGVVQALRNLASKEAINALHRLGKRIRSMPNLLTKDRIKLEKILAQSLPVTSKLPD